MVTIVYGNGRVMVFPNEVICDVISLALDHIEEYDIPFDEHQVYFLKRIRDTLDQEPKKENL